MSRTIDERVVSMEFDGAKFERNASRAITTLKALDLVLSKTIFSNKQSSGILNSLKGLANSGAYSEIGQKLDFIGSKFTALGRWAEQQKDKMISALESTVKSLSIDQVSAGWQKYADKTSAVQTIMAATAKDFDDVGEQMEYVNEQMGKLNWFTDETSYNFVDMVSNIGKFTSNSVKLDTAVTAMQGISTWAAVSGANATEASRAMYNLSQSLGTGAVKLMDWMSIENANMATAEFKETVLETAAELGQLKKVSEGVYKTLGDKGAQVTTANFRENLSAGWFTSDVLIKTLDRYGSFTDKLYELTDKTGTTATEFLSYIEDYQNGTLDLTRTAQKLGVTSEDLSSYLEEATDETYELGLKAFKAAQEAKTFEEAINSVKDAVSTGWMNTFELIFGDYQDAKKLWTGLANTLWDVFAAGGEARNELLAGWRAYEVGLEKTYKATYDYSNGTAELVYEAVEAFETIDGRDILLEALTNAFESLSAIMNSVKFAFRSVFPATTVDRLMEMTVGFRDLTERVKEYFVFGEDILDLSLDDAEAFEQMSGPIKVLVKGLRGIFSIGQMVIKVFKDIGSALFSVIKTRLRIFYQLGDTISTIGDRLYELKDTFQESKIYVAFIDSIKTSFDALLGSIQKINSRIRSFVLLADKELVENGKWSEIEDGVVGFFDQLSETIPKVIDELVIYFESLFDLFLEIAAWVRSAKIFQMLTNSIRAVAAVGQIAAEVLSDIGIALFSAFKSNPRIFAQIGDIIAWISDKLVELRDSFRESKVYVAFIDMIQNAFSGLLYYASKALIKIRNFWKYVGGKLSENGVWEKLESGLVSFFKDIQTIFPKIIGFVSDFTGKIWKWVKDNDIITRSLEWISNAFAKISPYVSMAWEKMKEFFQSLRSAFTDSESFSDWIKNVASALKSFGLTIKDFIKTIYEAIKNKIQGKPGQEGNIFSDIFESFSFTDWLKNLKNRFFEEWPGVKEFLSNVVENIKSAFSFVWTKISDIWTKVSEWADRVDLVGILGRLLSKIERIAKLRALWKAPSLLQSLSYFFNKTGGNLKGFVEALKEWGKAGVVKESLGSSLLKMAKAIAILIGAVAVLGILYELNPGIIEKGAKLLGGLAVGLIAFMGVLSILNGKDKKIATLGASLYKMALAIGILIGAMTVLAFMNNGFYAEGLIKLGIIMVGLFGFAAAFNKFAGKKIEGLIGVVLSILGLVYALKQLTKISWIDYASSLGKLLGIMVILGGFIAIVGKITSGTSIGGAIKSGFSLALSAFFGGLSALISVITLEGIGVIDKLISDWTGVEGNITRGAEVFKTTMDAMGTFLAASVGAEGILGLENKLVGFGNTALGGVSGLILTISADISAVLDVVAVEFMGLIDKIFADDFGTDINRGAEVFKTTMDTIGEFVNNSVKTTALFGLAGMAGVKVAAFGLVTTGILHLSTAINGLIDVAFVELAGALDNLFKEDGEEGVSSNLLNGKQVLETVRDAIDQFTGAANLGTATDIFTWTGSSLAGVIVSIGDFISDMITDVDILMQTGLLLLIGSHADWIGKIEVGKEAVEKVGEAIGGFYGAKEGAYKGKELETFSKSLPEFGKNLNDFASNLDSFDEDLITSAANLGRTFIALENSLSPQNGFVQWFLGEKDIGEFGNRLSTFGQGLKDFGDSLDDTNVGRVDTVVASAQSIIDLAKNASDFNTAGFSMLSGNLAYIAQTGFSEFSKAFSDPEGNLTVLGEGLIEAICSGIQNRIYGSGEGFSLKNLGTIAILEFTSAIESESEYVQSLGQTAGSDFTTNLKTGVSGTKQIGLDAVSGYISGLRARLSEVKSVASQIGSATKSALRNSIDSHSPSRDAYRIASDFVAGYNNSLRDSLPYVGYSAKALGEESVFSLEDALAQLRNLIDSDMDSNPIITPVFDMSNLDDAVALMNSGLETTKPLNVTASKAIVKNARAVSDSAIKMNGYNDSGVIEAINVLTNEVAGLKDSMSDMQVILDTGATVGALAPAMDKTLGQRAAYKGRGN